MSDILELMKTRRSIRKFKPDMVPKDLIEKIVEAGTYAPSGMNKQSPIIIAVTNKEVRDKLSKVNSSIQGNLGVPFYVAPVVLAVLATKEWRTYLYDGSLVMGNLMLAAHALNLGSCWIHRGKETFEQPEWKEWLESIGVEGEYEGIGFCIIGYVDGDYKEAAPRKEKRVFFVE